MPFTRKQINRILDADLISARQVPHNGLRLTESYLRRKLYSWEDRAVRQQWTVFDRAARHIRDYALRMADTLNLDTLAPTLAALQWKQAVQTFADQQITSAVQFTAVDAFRASLTAWYAGYYGKAWQLDVSTRSDVQVDVPTPDQFAAHRGVLLPDFREAVDVNASLYDSLGSEWRQAYETERDDMRLRLRRALNRGISDQTSVLVAMQFMRESMGLGETPDDGFKQSFYRMQTLTRTAIMDGAQDGGEALWRANSATGRRGGRVDNTVVVLLLSQTRWITARDERVCAICRGLDGQISSFLNPFRQRPPAHANCRCGEVPIIAEILLNPYDDWPTSTLPEWLAGFGGGLILDDFLGVGLESTQL